MKIFLTISTLIILIFFQNGYADPNCPFCNQKVIENQTVFEGDLLRVFVDHAPNVKGHLLVIPKRHVAKAHDLFPKEWEELSLITSLAVKVFKQMLNTDQYIILEKNGPRAFQSVPHVHFHLLPIQSQTWSEVFNMTPRILSDEELEEECNIFRTYFLQFG